MSGLAPATARISRRSDPDERRAAIIEDALDLLDKGESPEMVARQLGYRSARTLARLCDQDRWAEPVLAERLRRPRLGVWAA